MNYDPEKDPSILMFRERQLLKASDEIDKLLNKSMAKPFSWKLHFIYWSACYLFGYIFTALILLATNRDIFISFCFAVPTTFVFSIIAHNLIIYRKMKK